MCSQVNPQTPKPVLQIASSTSIADRSTDPRPTDTKTMQMVKHMFKTKRHLGYKPSTKTSSSVPQTSMIFPYGGTSGNAGKAAQRWLQTHNYIDWTNKNGNWRHAQYTCVNNQQQCGDCWANSITECLTIRLSIITGYYAPLDIDQFIGCSASFYANSACDGSSDLLVSMKSINKLEGCKGLSGPTCNQQELSCQQDPSCCTPSLLAAPITQSQCRVMVMVQPGDQTCCYNESIFTSDSCQNHDTEAACSESQCVWYPGKSCSYKTGGRRAGGSVETIDCSEIPSQSQCNSVIACFKFNGDTAKTFDSGENMINAFISALENFLPSEPVQLLQQEGDDCQLILQIPYSGSIIHQPKHTIQEAVNMMNNWGIQEIHASEITMTTSQPCEWKSNGPCYASVPQPAIQSELTCTRPDTGAYVNSSACTTCGAASYAVRCKNARQIPYPYTWEYASNNLASLTQPPGPNQTWETIQNEIIQELARGPITIAICASGPNMMNGQISSDEPVYNWYKDLVSTGELLSPIIPSTNNQISSVNIQLSEGSYSMVKGQVYLENNTLVGYITEASDVSGATQVQQLTINHSGLTTRISKGTTLYQKSLGNPNLQVDHAVLLVGYVECNGNAFWKIQNSWDRTWGDQGYFYVSASSNNTYFPIKEHNAAYPLDSMCVCEPVFADDRRPSRISGSATCAPANFIDPAQAGTPAPIFPTSPVS